MAFENVNVVSLKNAISSCKSSINYSTTTELISSISGNNVWSFSSKDTLKKALEKLRNTRYKELTNYLDKCSTAASYIEQYKEEEKKIKDYQEQIASLNKKISAIKANSKTYTICSGDTLGKIARNFGVSVSAIVEANGFKNSSVTIYAGQSIIIPGSGSSNISSYQSQIKSLNNKISQCRDEMEKLETKVSNTIG